MKKSTKVALGVLAAAYVVHKIRQNAEAKDYARAVRVAAYKREQENYTYQFTGGPSIEKKQTNENSQSTSPPCSVAKPREKKSTDAKKKKEAKEDDDEKKEVLKPIKETSAPRPPVVILPKVKSSQEILREDTSRLFGIGFPFSGYRLIPFYLAFSILFLLLLDYSFKGTSIWIEPLKTMGLVTATWYALIISGFASIGLWDSTLSNKLSRTILELAKNELASPAVLESMRRLVKMFKAISIAVTTVIAPCLFFLILQAASRANSSAGSALIQLAMLSTVLVLVLVFLTTVFQSRFLKRVKKLPEKQSKDA